MYIRKMKMFRHKFERYICCTSDLSTAARIIGFFGLAISVILMTVIINDKAFNNYEASRKTALALGLDWKHFHPHASTAHEADPEGRMISFIVIFYSVSFLITNILLLFASIAQYRSCTIPWLIFEFLGAFSKLGALIFHLQEDPYNISRLFITGSGIYITVIIWWWIVVFMAQQSWKNKPKPLDEIELQSSRVLSPREQYENFMQPKSRLSGISMVMESPVPYSPNDLYDIIE